MTGVPPPVDNPAAVHRGLLALARRRKADFNAILVQYAIERLIDRLSRSPHPDSFVLKGGMLFRIWTGELQRPTKDVDFLGHGDPSPAAVAEAVTAIVSIDAKDGLRFDAASIAAQEIREEHDYDGVRVTAYPAHVPITVRMDIGFGDAVTPPATALPFPTLLGHDPPVIRAYPPETAVAEKVEAICTLGIINSRMKDYCDLIAISRGFEIDGQSLTEAIRATASATGHAAPGWHTHGAVGGVLGRRREATTVDRLPWPHEARYGAAVTHRPDRGRQGIRPPSFGGCIRRRIATRSMEAISGLGEALTFKRQRTTARNARTRGHHLGYRGFVGNCASYRNWASGQHRIRTCDLYGVNVAL